jgi:ribosomal protein S18 acetylase RimI-like enzyme
MEIRVLDVSDAQAWWELRLAALQSEPGAFGQTVEGHLAVGVEGIARQLGNLGQGSFWLGCFYGEAMVGMVRFERAEGTKERHKGNIRSVFVAESQRGRGIGRALLEEVLRRARGQEGLEQVLLGVGSRQLAAMGLYESLGFERFGIEPRALKVEGQEIDEHWMVLWLR